MEQSAFAAGKVERRLRLVPDAPYPDWETVYRDNVGWVYGLLYAKVGNTTDAEDLTAEVFTAAMRPLQLTAAAPQVRAYLKTTARTALARYWSERMGRQVTSIDDVLPILEAASEQGQVPDAQSDRASRQARQILDRLPDNYRRILELRFMSGMSVQQSAETMGISVANAKVMQMRALRAAARQNEGPGR